MNFNYYAKSDILFITHFVFIYWMLTAAHVHVNMYVKIELLFFSLHAYELICCNGSAYLLLSCNLFLYIISILLTTTFAKEW